MHLRVAGLHHRALSEALLDDTGNEAVAFALCGRHASSEREVLLVQEVVTLPEDAYIERAPGSVSWRPGFLVPHLQKAAVHGLAVLKVHSHPGGYPRFSPTDDQADADLFQSVHGWSEVGVHASAVMLPGGSMFGRAVDADGAFHALDRVVVAGDRILVDDRDDTSVLIPAHDARHAQALGDATLRILRSLRIGVVGASGTGSFVIELLGRLGVGEMVVVDPEKIEEVNVNRILGSSLQDAREGRAKVEIAARSVPSSGLGTRVIASEDHLAKPEAVLQLASCDVVFGCMDSHDGRRLLNRLATFYLLPYIDVGIRVNADGRGGIEQASGAVHYLRPGGSSLTSRGVIDNGRADAEARRRLDPEGYEELLAQGEGYIRGGLDVTRPAVVSINGIFASMAVTELLARLHGFRFDDGAVAQQWLSLDNSFYRRAADGEPCAALAPYVGGGDLRPLLGMPELSL